MNCNICGRKIPDTSQTCPVCNTLGGRDEETTRHLTKAAEAMRTKDFVSATSIYHKLADEGVTEAQCAYGDILENGILMLRDLDLAMKYFHAAAEGGSPLGAYRYGRLASRASSRASDFWITYSAVLGCAAAYKTVASLFEASGDEESAAYYYSLSAADGDTESIVEMAQRYASGTGVEKSDPHARWYMDKLGMPPISAIKLSYRLRGITAEEPGALTLATRERMLRALLSDADKYKFDSAALRLCSILAAEGGADDKHRYAERLISHGNRSEGDLRRALELLKEAADSGSAAAARRLGDVYMKGELTECDTEAALTCYRRAAELGEGSSFEILGDVYCAGEIVTPDYALALEYYLDGAKEGHSECRRKADEILTSRARHFDKAVADIGTDDEEAFRGFATAAAMGHPKAYRRLALMLEEGRGTKRDRRAAFLWYEYALSEGDEEARFDLGRCYSQGIGTRFDFDRAAEILSAAKRAGSEAADRELYRIYENKYKHMLRSLYSSAMRLLYQKKCALARGQLEVCREMGHPAAVYALGCMYEMGLGMPTDRSRAEELYREAARAGFRDPKMAIKHRILKMGR